MADTEVLVIGGGIAGVSTAYHIAELGRDVTLLERGDIASEASGVNAGGIGALGWGHVPNLQSCLTMGSLQLFKHLQFELGFDIEFRDSGALQAIRTPEQYDYSRDNVLALKSRGYTLELLTVNEARGLEPELNPDLLGAVHFPLRAQADPRKATRAFADAAEQSGAQVLTGREVTAITRLANGGFRVACSIAGSGEVHTAKRLSWPLAPGAAPWERCWACTCPSSRFAARCGPPNPCRQGCFTRYQPLNRPCTGPPAPATTPSLHRNLPTPAVAELPVTCTGGRPGTVSLSLAATVRWLAMTRRLKTRVSK